VLPRPDCVRHSSYAIGTKKCAATALATAVLTGDCIVTGSFGYFKVRFGHLTLGNE
jgi:hypothetical protein